MGIAKAMVTVIVKIGFPEVMNKIIFKAGYDTEVVDCIRTSFFMYAIEG